MADDADEVKVFRNAEPDDLDPEDQTGQDNLEGDKKDVVLETELESNPQDNLLGDVKPGGAFSKPQPSPSLFAGLGGIPPMAFSPSAYGMNPMMPWLMMNYGMRPQMSPSFMPCLIPPAAMSPSHSFMNMICGPGSPLYGAMAGVKLESVPLPANMNMNMMRGNPLNQMNNMRLPYQGSPISSLANNLHNDGMRRTREGKIKKEDHIKKPLNAFMWFMKENRPKMLNEQGYKEKQSAELNKELGKRWHELPKEEQQKYFDMAKKDREDHKEKYPQWSARENYAVHKRKKRRRDKADESAESKKCRARFGTSNMDMWCKFCKRKKKCEYSYANSDGGMSSDRISASGSSGPSPMTSSMGGPSPMGPSPMDHNGSDSESDIGEEAEEATLTQLALQEVATQPTALMG